MPNGNGFQGKWTDNFSPILQRLPGERKAIASDLGVGYSTFDNWIRGEASFPPDLLSRLFAVTGERAILEFILEPLDMMAVSKARPNNIQNTERPDVYRHLMDAFERLGDASKEVRSAKEPNGPSGRKIDPSEYGRIAYFLRDIERLCAEIREAIKAEVTK